MRNIAMFALFVLCLTFSACGTDTDNQSIPITSETSESQVSSQSSGPGESSSSTDSSLSYSDVSSAEALPDSTYIYHPDARIEKLLTDYNEISEYPISSDMITDGAYDFSANISCNDVFVTITVSDDKFYINYQSEANDDSSIKPLFRDFCKAINPDITDEDVDTTWSALQSKEYQNYNSYEFKGIECTYAVSMPLSNGEYRFTVKSNEIPQ